MTASHGIWGQVQAIADRHPPPFTTKQQIQSAPETLRYQSILAFNNEAN